MRIVSLVPSVTETLFDLGISEVVGCTSFCVHPKEQVEALPKIGGPKALRIEKILALKPDLVIANKEENVKEQVEELEKHCRVLLTEIATIEDNRRFLSDLAKITGSEPKAALFQKQIEDCLQLPALNPGIKTAYLIWQEPYMTVGGDTFIHAVMQNFGLINTFGDQKRYPAITDEDLREAELILLSTEPYPFREKHLPIFRERFPHQQIILVEGEAFCWHGTRLAHEKEYFEKLLIELRSLKH